MMNTDKILDVVTLAAVGLGGIYLIREIKSLFGGGSPDTSTPAGEQSVPFPTTTGLPGGLPSPGGGGEGDAGGFDWYKYLTDFTYRQQTDAGMLSDFLCAFGIGDCTKKTTADAGADPGAKAAPVDVYRDRPDAAAVVKTLTTGSSVDKLALIKKEGVSFVGAGGTTQKSIVYSSSGGSTTAKVQTKSASPVKLLKGQTYNKITGQVRDF